MITCPNSVVETWVSAIRNAYPDSHVVTKTLLPRWLGGRSRCGDGQAEGEQPGPRQSDWSSLPRREL